MQRLSGLLLMLGGACVGAYGYLAPARNQAADLAEVTRISAAPDRMVASATSLRSVWPTSSASLQTTATGNRPSSELVAAPRPGAWTTIVSVEGSSPSAIKSSTPGDWQTRAELTRDLLRELKRVGCYGGPVTDAWTQSARDAMAAFTDRVNATLPVTQPDFILLNLLQNYRGTACGTTCPAGQMIGGDGRCVPEAVVAQASRKVKRLEERRLAAARLQNDRTVSAKADKVASAGEETVASAAPEELPWLAASVSPAEAPEPVVRPEVLPGRMSIGGPDAGLPPPPDGPASSVAATASLSTDPVDGDDLTEKPRKSKTKHMRRNRDRNYAYYDAPPTRWRYSDPPRGSVHYLMVHPLGFN